MGSVPAHSPDIILTLTVSLALALVFGFGALWLRLPPIVGYLIAGLMIGPHTPGFVGNREIAQELAEIGVILLMFDVGLHFNLRDLAAVRTVAVAGALSQIGVTTLVGTLAALSFGWPFGAAVIFGVALSVASTVVLTRVLSDSGELRSETGRISVGWLIVEDLFTVLVLVILPAVFTPGTTSLPWAIALAVLKLGALTAITLTIGPRLIPIIFAVTERTQSRELFTLAVLAIVLGIAVSAAMLFDVSMALGAFLAGTIVGQSEFGHRAGREALPLRHAFAVLFFVSVGMLFNPAFLLQAPMQVLITTAIILVIKPLAAFVLVVVLGYGTGVGLRVGAALGQIGEFSFLLATLGRSLGVLPDGATDNLVAASLVSITVNPLLYRMAPRIEAMISGKRVTK